MQGREETPALRGVMENIRERQMGGIRQTGWEGGEPHPSGTTGGENKHKGRFEGLKEE